MIEATEATASVPQTLEPRLTPADVQAALLLMERGAEFEKVRNALLVWFKSCFDVIFIEGVNGWFAKKEGEKRTYHRSFHELLQYLLDTYVAPTEKPK